MFTSKNYEGKESFGGGAGQTIGTLFFQLPNFQPTIEPTPKWTKHSAYFLNENEFVEVNDFVRKKQARTNILKATIQRTTLNL